MVGKHFIRSSQILAIAAALSVGCDAVEDAATEAAGVTIEETSSVETLKTESGWDDTNMPGMVVHLGFTLTEDSLVDMGATTGSTSIPIGELPAQDAEALAADKLRSLIVLKKNTFTMGENTYTRFEIVTVGKYENGNIVIDGAEFTKFMDADQRVGKENGNNAGTYLVVEGQGKLGLTYITGAATLKMNDNTTVQNVKDAIVFTDKSPFLAKSGSSGKFLLAIPDGSAGKLMAYRKDIASAYSATGTPETAHADILTKGLLDDYKSDVTGKAEAVDGIDSTTASTNFDKINTAVTDFLDGWTMLEVPLAFVQPPAAVTPPPTTADADLAPPTETTEPDPAPADSTIIRKEATTDVQIDLGCTGKKTADSITFDTIIRDGAKFDDYTTYPGWRCTGDCRISREKHPAIFGTPSAVGGSTPDRYPDKAEGYCLLTTGDALYQLGDGSTVGDAGLQPGPNESGTYKGQSSEIWQKVKVPSTAVSIQVRVAFFSQEFPKWVGSGFNDNFFIKFDEAPDFIGKGSLNDLAGMGATGTDAEKTAAKACGSNNTSITAGTQATCGQWKSVTGDATLSASTLTDPMSNGVIWNIDKSSQAVSQGGSFGCGDGTNTKCYHGWVPPAVICKPIAEDQKGKTLTLRFNISDAGDKYYDSALAIDSVVFSTNDCNTRFTGEDASRALVQ